MKQAKKSYLSYIWCLPPMLVSWLLVSLIYLFWGSRIWWVDGTLWCELKEGSWLQRRYKQSNKKPWSGTTFIMGGFYNTNKSKGTNAIDSITEHHEHFHIIQTKGAQLHAFIIGITVFLAIFLIGHTVAATWLGLGIWSTGGILSYTCQGIQAVVDHGNFYWNNHMEEAAKALDD